MSISSRMHAMLEEYEDDDAGDDYLDPAIAKAAKRIAQKTASNDHTGAMVELAKTLKPWAGKWLKVLEALKALHDAWGELPPGADEIRQAAAKELWSIATNHLTPREVAVLKQSF